MGKLSTSAFPHRSGSTVKTTGVLDLVHSDVMGPMQCSSKGGARFVVTFIDDFSRFVHVFLISAKSQVFQSFVTYKNLVENQTGARVKCLRSDNDKEFINKRVRTFCGEQGIIQQTSAPYSPQQNGLAERMNRTIVEMARSMLLYMGLELEWWGEAVNAAVYTINRVPNTARPHVSPFEVFFGKRPDLSHLRVFGSRGFVHVEKSKRSKWDPKAHHCIFLGYSDTSKAYRVWDLETERVLTSRTVLLDENPPASYSNLPPRADNTFQVAQWVDSNDDVARSGTQSPSLSTNEDIEMTSGEPDGIEAVNDCAEDMDIDERGADTAMVPSQPGAVLLHQAESGGEEQLLSLQRQPALPAPTLARSLTAAPRYASTTALAPLSRGGSSWCLTADPDRTRLDPIVSLGFYPLLNRRTVCYLRQLVCHRRTREMGLR
ncbi:hypothetical protein PF005_g18013 [Phytophthora fragariae]|uniref:Integrase catalytic domain-containing protein n=1 Tax=Phytophthora fragariae TaxID=53985 RepID=A0A6A3RCB0_9STRA|nr:hypothetical protein PF009_g17443 [Phytophthora fragariae]KAE9091335.1 hypothetical protein PF010_g18230 [Phytophthora fragariae]KAE9093695.1 hypothetical protein PF007_g18037 [Phytophthora fragariae]KAE9133385.1 hypothetical protein PF006_g15034 [Phytophthora fragariae]KAE9193582.1 hypothetical protein PF005_g18013 [Phytophthora fragariae]